MKNKILTLLMILFSISGFSQSEIWSKADRNNLFVDCMSYITKYKNTTNEQRESISLCYIGELTKKYTKDEFQSMIDIEIKRIKEAVINQCAKNLGIELRVEEKKEEVVIEKKEVDVSKNVLSKAALVGKWKSDDDAIYEFLSNGTYSKKYLKNVWDQLGWHVENNLYTGDWFLDQKGNLKLTENWTAEILNNRQTKIIGTKKYVSENGRTYKFIYFSQDYMNFQENTPNSKSIQANRIE